jgi:hypothetical protein
MRKEGEWMLNPKIGLIITQFFPNIVDRHIRTRCPDAEVRQGLERYRDIGYQTIRHLPPEQQEENREALDSAFSASLRQIEEFHAHEGGKEAKGARSDADVS